MDKNTEIKNTEESKDTKLSKDEIERYCRQMVLPEVGTENQKKLMKSKVLIIGAGGLGAPTLLYLAGGGVGTLGIIDHDNVDHTNLHRQIIHTTQNKGVNKAKSAAQAIQLLNPTTKVNAYEEKFTNKNCIEVCKDYDVLVDCSDNPQTRYLISDVAAILNLPLVSGSAVKWEGQLTIYNKDSTDKNDKSDVPCYRCMFPLATPTSAICNCNDHGVFGPVPGLIGTLQASETIKLIIGLKDKLLSKRMLFYDGLDTTFKLFTLRNKMPECIACSSSATITKENIKDYDYEEFVNPKLTKPPLRVELPAENKLKWVEFWKDYEKLSKDENVILLDVRPSEQYNIHHIPNFINLYLKELRKLEPTVLNEKFSKDKEIYVMCRKGNNSSHAAKLFLDNGYTKIHNLDDGMFEYQKQINPDVPLY